MNLKAADTVIFSDSDFNPQNDLRAAARAHRIGQNKAVKVIQLIGRDTVEEIVYRKAASKLQLTNTIIERDHFTLEAQKPLADPDLQLSDILKFGLDKLLSSEGSTLEEGDLESILGETENSQWASDALPAAGGGIREQEEGMLMYRGEAVEDFTGPDCRFVNFKKGDPVYVYYKLAEVSPELWAGSVGRMFRYFPKDFIKVVREYTKEELQIPTDETYFVCFDVGGDNFDNYNVEELLGFWELYDSANEDSEKAIEKVGQFPEVSQDVEPEPKPVVANSQQIESAFSENTVDLEEQFLAQKNHPHADSQTDNAQGEQTSFELFEEILPDKLKVPESEKNKTSNISQVSNEQEKTDAYKLLKKEINPYLETKENKQEMSIIWKILKKTETTAKRVDISQVSNEQEKTDAYKLLKKEINPYLETKENKQEMSIIWKILKKTETTAKRVDISQVSNEQEKTDAYKLLKKEINPYLETKENKQEMSIIWKILKKTETTAKRVDMMDKERGDMEMGKEESPLADEEAQGLFDRSDEENTQTSGISEVFQDKDSDDLEKDNPKEHLNTLESTEKATGKETSKEDLENIGHITDAKSQGPASADLEDDIFPQSPHIALKPELSDQEEDLPIIRSFFIEQKSLQRFLKYIDVQELEAMLQEMSLKLNSAQQESLPYNLMPYYLEKVLDKASESHILSVAEQMLDNRVNDNTDTGIKESNIFEEAAVLDDIQDLIYFVRYKHSTVEETAPLIIAPPLEEIWAKAEELLITEGTPVDAADTENQLEIKVEEPADATLLDNILFLLYSFLLYLSKMVSLT
ncbi:transport and Golgi organization protein 1 homolog isoform X1 [Ictidomys tridecemlineatus]